MAVTVVKVGVMRMAMLVVHRLTAMPMVMRFCEMQIEAYRHRKACRT